MDGVMQADLRAHTGLLDFFDRQDIGNYILVMFLNCADGEQQFMYMSDLP